MKQPNYASPFLRDEQGHITRSHLNAHFQESVTEQQQRLAAAQQWQANYATACHNSTFEHSSKQCDNTGLVAQRLAVKDLFHMRGLPTSAGNPDWLKSHDVATTTSPVIDTLLQAGAQFVGKTQTDELAYSLNGQNKHYGTPVNPAAPERLPGGSSSGSASAVALNLADIGLGTDTGGSIRVPASYQGLFGLRPTHNALPCRQMVALAPAFDTIGWMTRDLTTMKTVAETLLTETNSQLPNTELPNTELPKLAILTALLPFCEHAAQIHSFIDHAEQQQRANVSENPALNPFELKAGDSFRILQGAAIWQEHGEWLSAQPRNFAADIQARLDQCAAITQAQIHQASQAQRQVIEALNEVLSENHAILLPTTPGRAPLLSSSADTLLEYRQTLLNLTALAGLAGLPQLHLPLFYIDDSPCGLSLLGKAGSELQLIQIAEQLLDKEDEQSL